MGMYPEVMVEACLLRFREEIVSEALCGAVPGIRLKGDKRGAPNIRNSASS
jgi:hypothetical protein